MKCVMCGGKTEQKKITVTELGKALGQFEADVCMKCGEKYYSEEAMRKIQVREKETGIFGLEAETEVTQYGNSLAVRIKKALSDFVGLKKGKKVHVYPLDAKKLAIEVV
ncbi:MAG: hypothetical protein NTY90_05015 [Candidatus Micrarchaeota archaeon]|nr:hypothetical protein [Candidatus Micrarchaeota archaeon]